MSSTGIAYIISIIWLVTAAVWTDPHKPWQFLDAHGGFIVFGGFAVIAALAVPWEYLKRFFAMIKSLMRRPREDSIEVLDHLVQAAEKARVSLASVKDVAAIAADPFLKDCLELLLEGHEAEELEIILRRRIEVTKERENTDAKMFKNLGKFPPACGLVGTVLGMMALLGTLGQEGAEAKVGPSMSVAMAATLYGVILANVVILPAADNLMFRTQKTVAKREMILEGIMLIKNERSPVIVREVLLSHLTPTQRKAIREAGAAAAQKAAA